MNMEVTSNKTGGVVISDPVFAGVTLTATAVETWKPGTLLGRITATGKVTRYDSTKTNGSEVPTMVLNDEVAFSAAGDKPARVLINGKVRLSELKVYPETAIDDSESDALRDYGIIAQSTTVLSMLDNQ